MFFTFAYIAVARGLSAEISLQYASLSSFQFLGKFVLRLCLIQVSQQIRTLSYLKRLRILQRLLQSRSASSKSVYLAVKRYLKHFCQGFVVMAHFHISVNKCVCYRLSVGKTLMVFACCYILLLFVQFDFYTQNSNNFSFFIVFTFVFY